MQKAEIFEELMVLKERKLRNFSIVKLFITANKQELGGKFHWFTAKTRIKSFINFFPSVFLLLFLSSSQN